MKNVQSNKVLILTIIGLLADCLTIISVVFSNKSTENKIVLLFTDAEVSNWHMTFIWIISVFTYFGLLRYYWDSYKDTLGYKQSFDDHIFQDLIKGFKTPFILLPGVIIFGIFFMIWEYWVFLFLLGLLFALVAISDLRRDQKEVFDSKELESHIEDKWSEISNVIKYC